MHYYQFHIGDYKAATSHLSNEEDLAYRRLLDMYYDTEKPIPLDTQWVSKRLRIASEVVLEVLSDMFEKHDDGWFHNRCHEEIEHYHGLVEKNRRNGMSGGRPKKNPLGSESVANGNPDVTLTKNHEPITINHIQEPNGSPQLDKSRLVPNAPISEIVEMYNTMLPMLSRVTVLNDKRRKLVSARWREVVTADKLDKEGGLNFFKWYFGMVSESRFLTGRAKDWKADFEFLFNPSRFPRVIEGYYHKDEK